MESIEQNLEYLFLSSAYMNILNTIFKNCPDGFVYKDNELRYRLANKTFCEFFGVESSDLFIGKSEFPFLSKENRTLIMDINKKVQKDLEPVNYVITTVVNGVERVFNITSAPISYKTHFLGVLSVVKDITHEESMKEKFVLKHFQLKSLLENIPMLMYMQDKDFNYITGTKNSENFVSLGYDPYLNIYIDRSRGWFGTESENRYVISENKTSIRDKEVFDTKGIPHWYKVHKIPINDINGNVTGIITLAQNLDIEKQIQKQRETFVATLGHDLKNPTIAQIRGLELLLKGEFGSVTTEQRELMEMVLDSCRYMHGMLSSLLATYRNLDGVVKLNFETFSLSDLVMECVSEMIYVAKDKSVGISINSTQKKDLIWGDRVQIKRVIMNLISNGIKYAFKDSVLKLSIYTEKQKICFAFENDSPYIPEDKQNAIFSQYVSYASSHNELGIGLGLYASQKIIEAHNGTLFVQSFKDNRNIFGFKISTSNKKDNIEVHF